MTNDTAMRVLSAHETEAASGGLLKEVVINLYAAYLYDVLKNGGGTGVFIEGARKAVSGTLKPSPMT
jgi:hypothetical protein